ncbi:hypothetical protein Dret_2372 [Desulfohalobium retbaense DSM 5692]|uniref:Uncharacterized protein n=1 Tax=Desulfohalobium retbaense (strain ATCC 49708 / DSM 5692 / JCM 16813 / HR100) TaxID=485915 RepID=C8X5F7_DESRD|nr:hypothetical protein Dret_2372 [Desulfohalobium retbaense DSM 5692]
MPGLVRLGCWVRSLRPDANATTGTPPLPLPFARGGEQRPVLTVGSGALLQCRPTKSVDKVLTSTHEANTSSRESGVNEAVFTVATVRRKKTVDGRRKTPETLVGPSLPGPGRAVQHRRGSPGNPAALSQLPQASDIVEVEGRRSISIPIPIAIWRGDAATLLAAPCPLPSVLYPQSEMMPCAPVQIGVNCVFF